VIEIAHLGLFLGEKFSSGLVLGTKSLAGFILGVVKK